MNSGYQTAVRILNGLLIGWTILLILLFVAAFFNIDDSLGLIYMWAYLSYGVVVIGILLFLILFFTALIVSGCPIKMLRFSLLWFILFYLLVMLR